MLLNSVATREGGVDRNAVRCALPERTAKVATREGGVDRNVDADRGFRHGWLSPPARVAWIET